MWSNYALALYRTLSRHRLYAALNVLGLALGIAVCLILTLVVRFEASFDRWIPDARNIYRVNRTTHEPGRPDSDRPFTQAVLLPALQADFPQIRAAARLMPDTLVVRSGADQSYEKVVFADSTIFDVFNLPFVAGEPKMALRDDASLVLSQSAAKKYFGTDHALGRVLTLTVDGQARDYRVTGVLKDLPANTHLALDIMARFDPAIMQTPDMYKRWGSSSLFTYLRLRSPADSQAIQAAIPAFVDRRVDNDFRRPASHMLSYQLLPLAALHFHDAQTTDGFKPGADPLFVGALGLMGLVTLLIAIINYVSLATARSGMRAREVAVRKVMGATRRALILQFVAESVAMACGAGLIAAALAELAMPAVDAILGEPVRIHYFGADGVGLPLLLGCVVVGLVSGLYPALVLSGFRPAAVLASARSPGGGRIGTRVREGLAIFQFAIAITLMICTAVIFSQMVYVRNADLGFQRDGLIVVRYLGAREVAPHSEALLHAFRQTPGVVAATAADRYPATDNEYSTNFSLVSNPKIEPDLTVEKIGPDYAHTYDLHLSAGRNLGPSQRFDDLNSFNAMPATQWQLNVMLNQTAARAFGFLQPQKAIGQRLAFGITDAGKPLIVTIVGVVQDVRFQSPRKPVQPIIYMQDSRLAGNQQHEDWSAAVRVRESERQEVTQRLARIWRSMAPTTPFEVETVQAAMKPYYDPDARRGQLFASGAVLSAIIACLGLYGLAAFNTGRRFKEIGIRKTLGASTRDVMRLLIGEFLKPVLIANVIAWPLAWFAMRAWLAGFDQRIALNPAYFIAPTLAAVIVAVLTVADQTFRVARAEPAVALRYE
jgi:putative ABC transport system permease protein